MSLLTSTVPGAFDAFYNLLTAAGQQQAPQVAVMAQELQQYEPGAYVVLGHTPSGHKPVENHHFEPAALGSYSYYESYEFWGYATVYEGDLDLAEEVLASTWTLYQDVVMDTVIAYNGGNGSVGGIGSPILGANAPEALEVLMPVCADYDGGPAQQGGFVGCIEFCYCLKARLTIA